MIRKIKQAKSVESRSKADYINLNNIPTVEVRRRQGNFIAEIERKDLGMKEILKKLRYLSAGAALMLCLSGCGRDGSKITEGMQAIKDLDYQTALICFEDAEASGEDQRLIARGKGIACMGLTDYGQAAEYFESALKLSNGLVESIDYDLNYYLAASYTKAGRPEDAENVYQAILSLKPEEEDAYFLRGNVRLMLNKYELAQEDFDKVIAMDPKNYDRLLQIFEVLNSSGYQDAGKFYLETALQNGENQMSAYDKGRIYYYLGEYQKAYLALEEAKEKGGAEAYLYLGKAYEATQDYNYASNVYSSYLSKDPANAEMYNQLGLCEMAKGEYGNALSAFQSGKAIENNSMMQTLSFNEIVAYEHLGEYQTAAELMQAYLQNYPDDVTAQREYGFLSTR